MIGTCYRNQFMLKINASCSTSGLKLRVSSEDLTVWVDIHTAECLHSDFVSSIVKEIRVFKNVTLVATCA